MKNTVCLDTLSRPCFFAIVFIHKIRAYFLCIETGSLSKRENIGRGTAGTLTYNYQSDKIITILREQETTG